MSDNYHVVAQAAEIGQGTTRCIVLAGREILLCHTKEGFYAVDNLCTHAEARLSEGKLKACKILCPLHGAAFDVRDGAVLSKPATQALRCYPLRQEGDQILVALID